MNFFEAVLQEPFMQVSLLVALLSALICALVGPLTLTMRLSSAAGGIAHAALGGIGVAVFFGVLPEIGALIAAVAVALYLAFAHGRSSNTEAQIHLLWSLGMSLGIIFLALTPGYRVDVASYLFGNILLVNDWALAMAIAVLLLIVSILFLRFRMIELVCFDPEAASVSGVRLGPVIFSIYLMIALATVAVIQTVGLVLVISLMTISPMMVIPHARSLLQTMFLCLVLNLVFAFGGLYVAYSADLPTGATMVLFAGATFFLVRAVDGLFQKKFRCFGA